ncbi:MULTISPECIES: MliC family protein [Marinomonas]|uniref:Membrane-bound inhibitor of C-type lysozyme n=1 Tax=Marinomonas alcarazii TaxID=491949 RepID=A0A318V7I6_9GAMM|nr:MULTISPECIES: MliC family protein [Marinomonas]PYF83537.1 membrane-bound inhibitor of C-type lysozyme [Marinomonas alcarazii]
MSIKTSRLQKFLVCASLLALTACSSVTKETSLDSDVDDMGDISQTNAATYLCNAAPLHVFFHAENAQITWNDKEYTLTRAISASGSFYLGEGLTFWIHGETAELEVGAMAATCRLVKVES